MLSKLLENSYIISVVKLDGAIVLYMCDGPACAWLADGEATQ